MKKFIFLTPGITNMGGSEMYTYNKWRYLTTHGWEVNIFFFNKTGNFLLKELERYKDNCIPDLLYGISYLSKREQERIITHILEGIRPDDEVVVESHLFALTIWGELIAAKVGAKNILKCMEENIQQISEREAAYVEYKLKRNEILNSTPKSLHRYFGNLYKDSYDSLTHPPMGSLCSNVVTHRVTYDLQVKKADFNILSIGRLEKEYVIPTLMQVRYFMKKHQEHSFNMIIIGGDPTGEAQGKIRDVFDGLNNVGLFFLGYMYPIPSNLISMNDVAIASSNSVLVPSNEGVPTIAIDVHDNLPIGIYGRTTENKFSRDEENPVSVLDLLEDVLIRGLYPQIEPLEIDEDAEFAEVFGKQVEFLNLSPGDGASYDVRSLYPWNKRLVNQTKRYLHKLGI